MCIILSRALSLLNVILPQSPARPRERAPATFRLPVPGGILVRICALDAASAVASWVGEREQ